MKNYVAFILGYEEQFREAIQKNFLDGNKECDDMYDVCCQLAEEFVGSYWDDDDFPMYECLEYFMANKIQEVKKHE